ncbi:hypothetical protein BOH77_1207 [Staphylococcus aureus M1057]|nr:hypothetical protein BOH77_1207 [Staphylococcus aureus M1057]
MAILTGLAAVDDVPTRYLSRKGLIVTLNDVVAVLPLVSFATKLIVLFVADVTFGAVAETC